MRNLDLENLTDLNCYHVCTNGNDSPTLMKEPEDYIVANNYLAIVTWKLKITLLAFCLMSNHVHFLIACRKRMEAEKFIRLFKRLFSTYLRNKYGTENILHNTKDSISLIDSIQYLRNCIAYILRNPICARICSKLEDYQWSSYSCYFRSGHDTDGIPISTIGVRERRKILRTREDLCTCPYMIHNGIISARSFVRHDIVEKAFYNSGRSFLSHLGTCNDAKMEYEMTYKPLISVKDEELACIAEQISSSRFNGKGISDLTSSEKCSMLKKIYFNNKTSIPQLSRILGLPRELVNKILSS